MIYTRTGDQGETGLVHNKRVQKSDVLIEAIGAVDELNAWLGRIPITELRPLQSDLFEVGSILAGTDCLCKKTACNLVVRVGEMEKRIDTITAQVPPLKNFILPGGSPMAADLHIARTVCRRAERRVLQALPKNAPHFSAIVIYLNRLSDLLFMQARLANLHANTAETIWHS